MKTPERASVRLTLVEPASVWVDEPSAPFQIALVGVCDAGPFRRDDGSVDTARVRAELTDRVRRVPALRRQIGWPVRGRGRPVWREDAASPDRQVTAVTLPSGADFRAWCAQRIIRPLDLRGPLWRAEVVDGLGGGRFGLLVVVHHVLADGFTGVAPAGALLDPGPDRPGIAFERRPTHHRAKRANPCTTTGKHQDQVPHT